MMAPHLGPAGPCCDSRFTAARQLLAETGPMESTCSVVVWLLETKRSDGGVHVPMSCPPYPPEFRAEMVRLVRCGRTPEELAERFEPIAQTIRNWAKAAGEGLTDEEREELRQLRRRVRQLEDEREIVREPAVGSCFDSAVSESFFAARECEPTDHPSAFSSDDRAVVFDLIEGW